MNKFVQFLQNYKIFCTLSLTISNEPQNISLGVSHKPFLSGNSWCQVRLQSLITTTSLRISHYCCDGNCSKYVILHLCKRSTTASAEQWLCIGFTYLCSFQPVQKNLNSALQFRLVLSQVKTRSLHTPL